MRSKKHVRLKCGHCGKMFIASQNQAWRSTWASTLNPMGFVCSKQCRALLGVASRKCVQRLSPRKLAYSRVQNAIDYGKLIRPDVCSRCGNNPGRDAMGRSRIEGHHVDHNKPLEVEWLCDSCHKEISPRAHGERCGSAKFTEKQVLRIRKAFKCGMSGHKLASAYGVTPKAIYDIVNRKTWRHI